MSVSLEKPHSMEKLEFAASSTNLYLIKVRSPDACFSYGEGLTTKVSQEDLK